MNNVWAQVYIKSVTSQRLNSTESETTKKKMFRNNFWAKLKNKNRSQFDFFVQLLRHPKFRSCPSRFPGKSESFIQTRCRPFCRSSVSTLLSTVTTTTTTMHLSKSASAASLEQLSAEPSGFSLFYQVFSLFSLITGKTSQSNQSNGSDKSNGSASFMTLDKMQSALLKKRLLKLPLSFGNLPSIALVSKKLVRYYFGIRFGFIRC